MKKALIAVFVLLFVLVHSGNTYSQESGEKSLIYFIPTQGAQNVSPTTSLAIRQGSPLAAAAAEMDLFLVTGSESGIHSG